MIDKSDDELKKMEESRRFGTKIFDTMQSSFMPINEPNIDDKYVLGVGDEIEIQLIGGKNQTKNHTIKSDGSINIPDIGKVFLAGIPLIEASKLIKNKISESYTLTEAFVTLTNEKYTSSCIWEYIQSRHIYFKWEFKCIARNKYGWRN